MKNIIRTIIGGGHEPLSSGTIELAWRIIWLSVCTFLIAYASFLYFGSISAAATKRLSSVQIVDVIKKTGEHHLSGTVVVPSECHGLTVRTEKKTEALYRLVFSTWQEPSRTCEPHDEKRAFTTVVFAPPTGIAFEATLDDVLIPITIQKR